MASDPPRTEVPGAPAPAEAQKTVALTGATGFIGGHVLRRLTASGCSIRALTRSAQPPSPSTVWVQGALDQAEALDRLLQGADRVIHIAGVVNAPDAAGFDRGNRLGTQAILAAAHRAGIQRFVYVSSLSARAPDLSLYGASKRAGEDLVADSTLDWAIVRPPGVYGPGDTEMLDAFRAARMGVVPMPPARRMSWIHADDLARLLIILASGNGRVLVEPDDGRPDGWTPQDFGAALGQAVGRRTLTLTLPQWVVRAGAALDVRLRGDGAKLTKDRAAYLCHPDWTVHPALRPDPALWAPAIETPAGLKETARWYRDRGWMK